MTSPLQESVLKLAEAREPVFSFLSSDPGGYSDEEMDEDLQELIRLAITLTLERAMEVVPSDEKFLGLSEDEIAGFKDCRNLTLQNIKELMN